MASGNNQENQQMGSFFVRRVEIVRSKVPNPEMILRMSNLDRQCPSHMYLLFFYERNEIPPSRMFDDLRSSLEETLSVWYPAAGRLTIVGGESAGKKLKPKFDLLCNNEGAVLVESVTTVKIPELGNLSRNNEFFEKLVSRPKNHSNISEMPLLVAQVTHFECGGFSIGIGTSHSLFDGPAALDFLRSWSANSTSTKGSRDLQNRNPVFERGRLLISTFDDRTSSPLRNTTNTKANGIEHMHQLIKQAAIDHAAAKGCSNHSSGHDKYSLQTFRISKAQLESLRKRFDENSTWSSFEVVSAHLWKARTRALGIKKQTIVCLQFAVDTRTRVVPLLPKSFAGNAYVLASVALTAGQLEEASYEDITRKIRKAKESITCDYVEAYMNALERAEAAVLPPLEELTIISDWTRIPFHEVEFLGKRVDYVSPLVAPVPYVAYLMRSPKDDGAIDVRMGLRPGTVRDFVGCSGFDAE
ncbi:hypothetical protein MLD38_013980 [Melastoma candidum]|uniref:Uncharacterized protein n=1 Tax=Melastoma candidum TaxID=119954 RepID=A0ACB9RBW6_9MYRT|nr:hypothetical protein MLD38_013980 [Melastoma candidum]